MVTDYLEVVPGFSKNKYQLILSVILMKMSLILILFVYFTPAVATTLQKLQLLFRTNDFVTSTTSGQFKAKIIYNNAIKNADVSKTIMMSNYTIYGKVYAG